MDQPYDPARHRQVSQAIIIRLDTVITVYIEEELITLIHRMLVSLVLGLCFWYLEMDLIAECLNGYGTLYFCVQLVLRFVFGDWIDPEEDPDLWVVEQLLRLVDQRGWEGSVPDDADDDDDE